MSKNKVWMVRFDTESCDHYMAVFNEKPTDGHLSAYVKERFGEVSEENGKLYRTIFWTIEETTIEDLPKPIKPIEQY